MNEIDFVRSYIKDHCVLHGEFESPFPGKPYDWIIQPRKALMNPEVCFIIVTTMLKRLAGMDPQFNFQICTPEESPLGAALSLSARYLNMPVNVVLCKREIDPYGALNQFEGDLQDKTTVIIDEMSNSGKSMKHCFDSLNAEGIYPAAIAMSVISKKNGRGTSDIYLPKEMTVLSLFNLDDFDLTLGKRK